MKAPRELLGEYIQYYASMNSSWDRFWKILLLDFNPEFIKPREEAIRIAFGIKRDIQTERRMRYNRVA